MEKSGVDAGKAKILVCEDNPALSAVVSFNLVRAGFQVTTVANGRLALEALQKDSFDLILSDQQMPMMTGIQLCEHVRQLPAHKRTPVHPADRQVHGNRRNQAATNPGCHEGVAQAVQPE